MKKSLVILVLGLLWCNTSIAIDYSLMFDESSLPSCYEQHGGDYEKYTNCYAKITRLDNKGVKYVYEGEWKNGKYHRKGAIYWEDGDTYVGEFKDGNFHGTGMFKTKDGTLITGEFKNNLMNGKVTMQISDGSKYVGEWKDGKRHGKGIYTSPDGKAVGQVYELGKLIEEKSAEQIAKKQEYERLEVKHRKKCNEFDKETPKYKNCIYDTENKEISENLNQLKKAAKGNTIFYSGEMIGTREMVEGTLERFVSPLVTEFTVTDEGGLQGKFIYTYDYRNVEETFYEIELDGLNLKAFFMNQEDGKDSYGFKTFGYDGWVKIIFDGNFESFNGHSGGMWKHSSIGVITVGKKSSEWTGKIIEEEDINRVIKSEEELKIAKKKAIKDEEERLCGGRAFLRFVRYDKNNEFMRVCLYSSEVIHKVHYLKGCPPCMGK